MTKIYTAKSSAKRAAKGLPVIAVEGGWQIVRIDPEQSAVEAQKQVEAITAPAPATIDYAFIDKMIAHIPAEIRHRVDTNALGKLIERIVSPRNPKSGPVDKMRQIVAQNPSITRQEFLAICEGLDLNPNTAKTQWQNLRPK